MVQDSFMCTTTPLTEFRLKTQDNRVDDVATLLDGASHRIGGQSTTNRARFERLSGRSHSTRSKGGF